MKRLLLTVCVCVVGVLGLQLSRPSIPTPYGGKEVSLPPETAQVLRTSCYSCHSNERRLAWFDEIVPAYWLVRHDITKARRHLNFSTLGSKAERERRAALFEAVNMADLGEMPLKSFATLHPGSRLSSAGMTRLKTFLAPWHELPEALPDPNDGDPPIRVAATPLRLAFDRTYPSWHLLSVTDRGDNNTFRFILGNEIAYQAAREGNISPWPEGTRFAKIAWQQRRSAAGLIEPGAFLQVELMVKGAALFGISHDWSWGRWKGSQFNPYGADASFVEECTGCHSPMHRNDSVFTMPILKGAHRHGDTFNERAAGLPDLPFNPLDSAPVTMYVDRDRFTISVLYRQPLTRSLLLLTWKESDDPHWFGARIPGDFLYAEYVRTVAGSAETEYRRIARGGEVDRSLSPEAIEARMQWIMQLKPAPYLNH